LVKRESDDNEAKATQVYFFFFQNEQTKFNTSTK